MLRQLERLRARPDLKLQMKIRVRLLKAIDRDFDWYYARLKLEVEEASKDTEPRSRLIAKLLDKLLVEQRAGDSGTDVLGKGPIGGGAGVTINVYGVDRGTTAARTHAEEARDAEFREVTEGAADVPASDD